MREADHLFPKWVKLDVRNASRWMAPLRKPWQEMSCTSDGIAEMGQSMSGVRGASLKGVSALPFPPSRVCCTRTRNTDFVLFPVHCLKALKMFPNLAVQDDTRKYARGAEYRRAWDAWGEVPEVGLGCPKACRTPTGRHGRWLCRLADRLRNEHISQTCFKRAFEIFVATFESVHLWKLALIARLW